MTLQSWLMYLTLVVAATASPGPAVLFVVTNSTLYGRKKAFYAALGNIIGLFFLGVMAVAGLGTVLKTSEIMFNIVKFIGAGYLVYLGIRLLLKKGIEGAGTGNHLRVTEVSSPKIFLQAFGVAMSNPKAIIFLTALFPQFVNIDQAILPQFSILIGVLMIFSFSFLMMYSSLACKTSTWLVNETRLKAFNRTSGVVFIGFGCLLAASSNK